mmetsp:Transcript_11500/g.32591  ORF Transcript_11500/g.32591 Transcript_11500/m.32591 type:complete len:356 (-) Transcript_11500:390-1457(-)
MAPPLPPVRMASGINHVFLGIVRSRQHQPRPQGEARAGMGRPGCQLRDLILGQPPLPVFLHERRLVVPYPIPIGHVAQLLLHRTTPTPTTIATGLCQFVNVGKANVLHALWIVQQSQRIIPAAEPHRFGRDLGPIEFGRGEEIVQRVAGGCGPGLDAAGDPVVGVGGVLHETFVRIEYRGVRPLLGGNRTDDLGHDDVGLGIVGQRYVGGESFQYGDDLVESLLGDDPAGIAGNLGVGLDGVHPASTQLGRHDGKQRERAGAQIQHHLTFRPTLGGVESILQRLAEQRGAGNVVLHGRVRRGIEGHKVGIGRVERVEAGGCRPRCRQADGGRWAANAAAAAGRCRCVVGGVSGPW